MRRLVALGIVGIVAIAFARSTKGRPEPQPEPEPAHVRTVAPPAPERPRLANPSAYIPPQCYAQTRVAGRAAARNSCAACHQASRAPNFVDDADVQSVLSIPRAAAENPWTNALHPPAPAAIDDAALLAYVRTDNYGGAGDTGCAFAPDAGGWDHDARGALTGWRAYAYAPMPGMFWPTNGSAGDAFIRLPEPYRRDAAGEPSQTIYALNLAILESTIRRTDVAIPPADEATLGVDLDNDGALRTAKRVAFAWPPREGRPFHYVGQAASLVPATAGWPAAGLFPAGTEIVHSLRYLDVDGGHVRPAPRMKEVRYMRKARWLTYSELDLASKRELREKEQNPDTLKHVFGDGERGVGTGGGWVIRGYIEGADGALRSQTLDETAGCIGCHGGVGASVDGTFSFGRKTAWGPQSLAGMREPVRADGRGEYRTWLDAVGAGDDYASNAEVAQKFFGPDGHVLPAMARALAADISVLALPSPQRALALDRAYLAIVRAQSFTQGRDAFVGTPQLEAKLVQDGSTGVTEPITAPWELAKTPDPRAAPRR